MLPCLQAYGALPVLYASQWFLTAFSCPFSAAFSARVIDVMLTENCPDIMLRTALVVLAECQQDLLQLADFEYIITFLKVHALMTSALGATPLVEGWCSKRTGAPPGSTA